MQKGERGDIKSPLHAQRGGEVARYESGSKAAAPKRVNQPLA